MSEDIIVLDLPFCEVSLVRSKPQFACFRFAGMLFIRLGWVYITIC